MNGNRRLAANVALVDGLWVVILTLLSDSCVWNSRGKDLKRGLRAVLLVAGEDAAAGR
jgi:hypothetical protein